MIRSGILSVEICNAIHRDSVLEHPVFGKVVVVWMCLNNGNSEKSECGMVMYHGAWMMHCGLLTCMRPIHQGRRRLWYYPKWPSSQARDWSSGLKKKKREPRWWPTRGTKAIATGSKEVPWDKSIFRPRVVVFGTIPHKAFRNLGPDFWFAKMEKGRNNSAEAVNKDF